MSTSAQVPPLRRLLPLVFLDRAGGQRVRLGRLDVSQNAVVISAALIIGVGGGYGAVGFRRLIDFVNWAAVQVLGGMLKAHLGAAFVIVPLVLGGAFVAWFVARFAPEAKGHGVPEVMAAVALRGGIIRPRVILVKSLASAISIGVGGSCGREGPIVQIGSAIGSVIGQWLGAPAALMRTLVACGAAAGISATFNAPIGGVFFASEIILGEFAPRSFAAIVVASVAAAVIGRAYLGNRPSFDAGAFTLVSAARTMALRLAWRIVRFLGCVFRSRPLLGGRPFRRALDRSGGEGGDRLRARRHHRHGLSRKCSAWGTTACRKCSTNTFRPSMRWRSPC